jgi:arginine decarboxylase
LQAITRLEQCWAYPGPRLLAAVGEAMAQRDAATFARLVQKISGAMLTGDYRRSETSWDPAAASEGRTLESTLPPDVDRGEAQKPSFEVLIVTPTDRDLGTGGRTWRMRRTATVPVRGGAGGQFRTPRWQCW